MRDAWVVDVGLKVIVCGRGAARTVAPTATIFPLLSHLAPGKRSQETV